MPENARSDPDPPAAPTIAGGESGVGNGRDAVEYNEETDTYRTSFDENTDSVTRAVVTTVAAVAETDPLDLPPLASVVDPDVLESLVTPTGPVSHGTDTHIAFSFDGRTVTVYRSGIIAVEPIQKGN